MVLEILTINLNDFSHFMGTIILMPIILIGAYHCMLLPWDVVMLLRRKDKYR